MLKAVRFDEANHKELIDFIESYRDKKNRPNHSEAIRFLMEKGFATLNQKEETKQQTQQNIDIEKLTAEITSKVWESISKNYINNSFPISQQNQYTQKEEIKKEQAEQPVSKPKTTIPIEGNSLLSNMLRNANR
jgi:hypothetical protein